MNESAGLLYGLVYGHGVEVLEAQRVTRLICRYLGGNDVYLPSYSNGNPICRKIEWCFVRIFGEEQGLREAKNFFRRANGVKLYIPQELRAFKRSIALEVLASKERGESNIALSERYHVSGRTIQNLYNYGARIRAEQNMPSLF